MSFELPKLYPITDRRLSGLSHAEQVARLSDGGATVVQLREKHLGPREFYREAEEALRVARERGVRLIINDRADIALALGADGVHLGQDDMPPRAARASCSCARSGSRRASSIARRKRLCVSRAREARN